MDSDCEVPSKKKKKLPSGDLVKTCIFCNGKSSVENLTQCRDLDSWKKVLNAGKIRAFEAIIQFNEDAVPQDVWYHLECRKRFVHKKKLEELKKQPQVQGQQDDSDPPAKRIARERGRSSSLSRIYDKECIFCEKAKYVKGTHSRETLIKAIDLRSDDTLRKRAQEKMDTNMLRITSRDLVAAEAHYHRSCYRNYTRVHVSVTENCDDEDYEEGNDADRVYQAIERKAYSMLFQHVRDNLFARPNIETMVNLIEFLSESMVLLGAEEIKLQTKNHIRRKLENEFRESLHIFSDDKGRLLVMPHNLTKETLAKQNHKLAAENESLRSGNQLSNILQQCALYIRSDIKKVKQEKKWPPQPEQLTNDYLPIPTSLSTFMTFLLTGECSDSTTQSPKNERLVNSISHDVMFTVSAGRQTSAKHILLPWVVKTLTGNVELIKSLNRLGHGISYSNLEEIETALCMLKLEKEDEEGIVTPSNIHPCVATVLAFDNIDRNEETLSGAGTSHRVNGIAIQPRVHTAPMAKEDSQPRTKQRSIKTSRVELPVYNAGVRVGPKALTVGKEANYHDVICSAKTKNHAWSLVRQQSAGNQKVSSWTGFNIQTRNNISISQDSIGYLPTINAPATEMSTVQEILRQVLQIMEKLNLQRITCIFDQALYAKAVELVWKDDKFQPIVIRLGVFHTLCNLMSTIGKRFKDAGLKDLAIESSVIAEGSIEGVLVGKKYNRAVRFHKLLYEAFLRIIWMKFFEWMKEENKDLLPHVEKTLDTIGTLDDDITQDQFDNLLKHPSCVKVIDLYSEYLNTLRKDNGNLSSFWMSYIDMVEILLGLIRASREGNWMLHLAMIRAMIPWTFAYDKLNYARYLPVYYGEMLQLEEKHPEVFTHMQNGGFSVQLGSSNPFSRVPVDQTIEETANKDTQTAGGTKGFSLNPGAISRFYLTAEYRSTCLRRLREMVELKADGVDHPDLHASRIKRDEKDINSLLELIDSSWINPFSSPNELVSLSTGRLAPDDVCDDLLRAEEKGNKAFLEFKRERLETDRSKRKKKFHDKMSKQNLKTFSSIQKSTKTKIPNKEVILKADNKLFGHLILVASSRQLGMREVLKHPLGPLPWSLANADGSLKKTNKSSLARHLEKLTTPAEDIPQNSAVIIDGMALVNKVNPDKQTYGELADTLFQCLLRDGCHQSRIDVVFDVYKEVSIKNTERENRGNTDAQVSTIMPGHKVHNWKLVLRSSASKTALIKFLFNEWQKPIYLERLGETVMYVTCQSQCIKLSRESVAGVPELETSQEEADTRMMLHAKHASAECSACIIVSEDTDVLIIALSSYRTIGDMFMRCGTRNRIRYIDVSKLGSCLGETNCNSLIGLHSFTGCDSTSSFAGKGKIAGLKLVMKTSSYGNTFSNLGKDWTLLPDLFNQLQIFTCKLYAAKMQVETVNELRYELFRSKKGEIESWQLPPCEDSLKQHALRANYQAGIWRRCLENHPNVPSPDEDHGWVTEDGSLGIQWMTGLPAPQAILEIIACKCIKECKLPKCECLSNGFKCTPACRNQSCANMKDDEDEESVYDEESSDGYESSESSDDD